MTTDRYTRLLLGLIAFSLAAIAAHDWIAVPQALAADTMRCEIVGDVKITGKVGIDTFGNPVQVKTDELSVRLHDTVPVKIDGTVQTHSN